MIYENIYNKVLIAPCAEGADSLSIISGFATPAMATRHLVDIAESKLLIPRVSLIVGMCPANSISLTSHRGFNNLVNDKMYGKYFCCSYVTQKPPVHTKLYIWHKGDKPYKAFIGSANYTQNAFFGGQREALDEVSDIDAAQSYFDLIAGESIYCDHQDAEDMVQSDKSYYRTRIEIEDAMKTSDKQKCVRVPLLMRNGEMPTTSGLNWGQREGREHNQAYLKLTPDVYNSDFFPPAPECFTVRTDDGKYMICRRAQKSKVGEAIHTPANNSLFGEYFRNRLGLANGAYVTKEDLLRYGRTDVTFYKLDNDEYLMDFSIK